MNKSTASEIEFLRGELVRRVEKNPQYSVRAFAKSLGIHVSALSAILNGKRPLTLKTAQRLMQQLALSPQRQSEISKLIVNKKMSMRWANPADFDNVDERVLLDEEVFRVISEWYHYGILQLITTQTYQDVKVPQQHRWMARQLRISETEIKLAIERLLDLKLLKMDEAGRFQRTQNKLSSPNKKMTSAALIKSQRRIREKAIESLERDPIEVRSHTSMTMAIDLKKIDEARKLIDDFQGRLSAFLENGKKEKVYQLEISLFPLQILEN